VKTLQSILAELRGAGLEIGHRQLVRNMKALGLTRLGTIRTHPAFYPADSAARILEARGFTPPPAPAPAADPDEGRIMSLDQLHEERARARGRRVQKGGAS